MTRKNFDAAVHETAKSQGVVAQNQFDKAELILKNAKSVLPGLTEKKGSSVERPIFSMPATDLSLIDAMRSRAGKSGRISTSKSEVVRAGLHALAALNDKELVEVLDNLQKVRKGN